mgnify:CR=1 FL=1
MNQILITGDQPLGRGGMSTIIRTVSLHLKEKNALAGLFFDARSLDGIVDTTWLEDLPLFPTGDKTAKIIRKQAYIFRLIKLLKQNPDIRKIVCLTPNHCRLAYLATKFVSRKIEIISWIHFSVDTYKQREKRNLIRSCNYHLVISSGIREQLVELGAQAESCFVVYNSVSRKTETIERPKIEFSILYLGRIEFFRLKNLKELFSSVEGLSIPWHLHIVGSGSNEDLAQCRTYAQKIGIDGNITWHGWQSRPWDYIRDVIQKISCCVLSSKREGFAIVLTEAMSYGIPCVSSDCPTGPRDIIQNGVNGYLYQNTAHADENLRQALLKLYKSQAAFNPEKIKASITKFYSENYLARLDKILLS